ncbi:nicotinamide riboside transporter PnuC [Candidatus Saccharibacteria bacterium RIFCSPHIGHO2_12_FULL_42_8]|nr:MAG: nicotinamide riboside transporter PnuC [Candidatus Saccharibacteria bacterium RIFCSPHIGHO2_12_FULL_42_8]
MNELLQLLSVDNIFFTVIGYPISYIEFVGTIFTLASVVLVAKRNILTWPVSLVGVVLFGILFYQINLYADLFEQIYYFITSIWGWYMWKATKDINKKDKKVEIRKNSAKENGYWLLGIAVTSVIASIALANIHILLPQFFPEPASLPTLDATTTVVSFAATILMMKRKLESWILWVCVDVVAIGLYWYKEVPFIALLYLIFLVIATLGFFNWRAVMREQK